MSGRGGGAQQAVHSLAFRVMRLCRPTLHVTLPLSNSIPAIFLFGGPSTIQLPLLTSLAFLVASRTPLSQIPPILATAADSFSTIQLTLSASRASSSFPKPLGIHTHIRKRFVFKNVLDNMLLEVEPSREHIQLLLLAIYLGETFCSYISINNSSNFEVRDVIIKAEIQTERQRIVLLDTSKTPVESIRAGGRYDFIVEHDVKELGAHTLVCTALYSDGDSERKYLPQFFKFIVSNPLSVRTKVRNVKVRCGVVKALVFKSLFSQETTFLEACIENHTKANLYMDQVEFEPAQHWSVTALKTADHALEHNLLMGETFKEPVLIRSGGGIYNYLYELKFSSPHSGQVKVEGSNILGKLQITWRTNLGEPGRLQTQHIVGNVSLKLINLTERVLGPFEVWLSESDLLNEKAVMVNGLQTMTLGEVQAFSSLKFQLNLIATKHGIQKISGITVFDTVEKKTYSSLLELERLIAIPILSLVKESLLHIERSKMEQRSSTTLSPDSKAVQGCDSYTLE
ncbi:UNVERIFIED_CONTAM: Trafficking protein particle complex subunit [Sesamum calycinum]|uniref:Trafficking protein particle complex subunit n=1 Tax=Sesamum calycinum TaxID=2727403 RepID=A0AAW2MBE8_9LAMI